MNFPVSGIHQKESSSGFSVEEIVKRSLQYWPLLILAGLLSFIAAKIYLRYTDKAFQVQSRMIVNDEEMEMNTDQLQFNMYGMYEENPAEKEIEILKSSLLIAEVVKKLSLQANLVREGNISTYDEFGNGSPFTLQILQPDSIKTGFSGPVKVRANDIEYLGKTYPYDSVVQSPFGLVKWQKGTVSNNDIDYNLEVSTLTNAIGRTRGGLTIYPISEGSSILDLFKVDQNTERGKVILETLMQVYQDYYVQYKSRIANNTVKFLDQRLAIISGDVSQVEKDLENFKQANNITDLSSEGQIYFGEVTANDRDLAAVNVQLQVLDQVSDYVSQRNADPSSPPVTLGLEDAGLNQLLTQLYQAEFEREKLEKTTGPKNIELQVLKDKIEKLKPSINSGIKNIRSSLEKTRNSIIAQSNRRSSQLRQLPVKERKLVDITRDREIKNSIYIYLLEKREESAFQAAAVVPNSRVLEAPFGGFRVSPNEKLVYAISWGSFFGLLALFIFLKEFANPRFLYKSDIEKTLQLPIVGELEYVKNFDRDSHIIVKEGARNVINEQFRDLRTNIAYLGRGKKSQTLLITSSKSGEGKTFVGVNLALSLAQAGKKVVIVETDLRRPKVSKYLGEHKKSGMSEFLIGNLEIERVVYKTELNNNLYYISSGAIPPNPAELLMQEKFNELLNYLRQNFDVIILDAPPVGIVTDAKLVGRNADVCLYIVRQNYTQRSYESLIKSLHDAENFPNVNIVFNAIRKRGVKYGKSYGYGYEYGYYDDKKANAS